MTLELILTRHAKSDWGMAGLDDHARPLNARGVRAAKAMGRWLTENGLVPDLVLASDAVRARETVAQMGLGAPVRLLRQLYLAGPGEMLAVIAHEGAGTRLMLVGHNPGIGALAARLAEAPPDHPKFLKYPTGATTVLELPIEDWHGVKGVKGRVSAFVVPRELPG